MQTRNFLIPVFIFTLLLMRSQAQSASLCPWLNQQGANFIHLDAHIEKNKNLTIEQIQADLDCLRILLENVYSYKDINPNHEILKKLANLSSSLQAMTSSEFIEKIFSIHSGHVDSHLSYQGGGIEKRFSSESKSEVKLNKDLEEGKIIDRDLFVYFKTGEVPDPTTKSQNDFIQLVRDQDRNLVIDLRGNGGGDDGFANELAEAIFTQEESIPQTKQVQLFSPLSKIGYCITLSIVYGPEIPEEGKKFCNNVRNSFSKAPFAQLLPRNDQIKTVILHGKRSVTYKSKIYVITDSSCASSCETIVEKLSLHPRVVTIGQSTYGALHFSNAGTFVLPNSEIVVHLPTLRQDYENEAKEGVGYQPKIETSEINLNNLSF